MTLSDLNDLDFNNLGTWPLPAKIGAVIVIIVAVSFAGWYFHISNLLDELESKQRQETSLRSEFQQKQRVVANIDAYRERLAQLEAMLDDLIQQLPTGTEMPDLLEEVSNLGRLNGLVFQLFRPESERRQEFFAAVPISIRATGTYHQFGQFISSIAGMERIVTLENAELSPVGGDGQFNAGPRTLNISATLQTYRYLELE